MWFINFVLEKFWGQACQNKLTKFLPSYVVGMSLPWSYIVCSENKGQTEVFFAEEQKGKNSVTMSSNLGQWWWAS